MSSTVDALRTGGKRVRTHDGQIVVKLPKAAKALIEAVAEKEEASAGAIVRDAIAEYLERRGYRS